MVETLRRNRCTHRGHFSLSFAFLEVLCLGGGRGQGFAFDPTKILPSVVSIVNVHASASASASGEDSGDTGGCGGRCWVTQGRVGWHLLEVSGATLLVSTDSVTQTLLVSLDTSWDVSPGPSSPKKIVADTETHADTDSSWKWRPHDVCFGHVALTCRVIIFRAGNSGAVTEGTFCRSKNVQVDIQSLNRSTTQRFRFWICSGPSLGSSASATRHGAGCTPCASVLLKVTVPEITICHARSFLNAGAFDLLFKFIQEWTLWVIKLQQFQSFLEQSTLTITCLTLWKLLRAKVQNNTVLDKLFKKLQDCGI